MTKLRLFLFFLTIAGVGLALHSCLKESPAGDFGAEGVDNPLTMKEAQTVFEEALLELPETRSCGSVPFIPPEFAPDWDGAEFRTSEKGSSMIVPLVTFHRVFAKRDSLPGRPPKESYFVRVSQTLLIIKNSASGRVTVYIQSVIPDKKYYDRHRNRPWFNERDLSFSGFVQVSSLAGRPLFVDVYRAGDITGRMPLYNSRSKEERNRRIAILQRYVGRTLFLATPLSTRNGDQKPVELDVVKLDVCDCGGSINKCKCTNICGCNVCEDQSCPNCGNDVRCPDCPKCNDLLCLCDCDDPSLDKDWENGGDTDNTGDGDDEYTGGGGNGGNGDGNKPGGSSTEQTPTFQQLYDQKFNDDSSSPADKERIQKMIEGVYKLELGKNLIDRLNNVNIEIRKNVPDGDVKSIYDFATNTISLYKDATPSEVYHEIFHAVQAQDWAANNPGVDMEDARINLEIEAWVATGYFASTYDMDISKKEIDIGGHLDEFGYPDYSDHPQYVKGKKTMNELFEKDLERLEGRFVNDAEYGGYTKDDRINGDKRFVTFRRVINR